MLSNNSQKKFASSLIGKTPSNPTFFDRKAKKKPFETIKEGMQQDPPNHREEQTSASSPDGSKGRAGDPQFEMTAVKE